MAIERRRKRLYCLRIRIRRNENGKEVKYQYYLDRYQDNTISMARTTGFTCTAVANLVIDGKYHSEFSS